MSEFPLSGHWPVAVWQCFDCGAVETRTLLGGYTQYAPPSFHSCGWNRYGAMEPLNQVAKSLNQAHTAILAEREAARLRLEDELKNWPPAPGYRCYWETPS